MHAARCLGRAHQAALRALVDGPLIQRGRCQHFVRDGDSRRIALNTARSLTDRGLARLYHAADTLAICLTAHGEQYAIHLIANRPKSLRI